ncbi:Putative deoxyribonuclease RhsC [Actinoalloteichus hoggarensis]|uniref:Putative deoxyribonuclease RhsC n=1 Tax=Actinoalloteichus hoggarensis TaxID=1470176 RepID=A0A221W9G3_9PSEU|nr:Putative deoxyribonuclease RhsC [Actinoalloteichus hoggarensis]
MAEVVDSTTPTSGLSLVESVNSTSTAIQNGDWLEAGLGTADLVMTALDPFAAIISNGVGWLLEHVGPLSDALDSLAGNPDEIRSHAETWTNVAGEVNSVSTELGNLIKSDITTWTGAAADAYRERAADTANLILAAGNAAQGAADGIQLAGEVVTAVRDAVRDIIADVVGSMVSWALQVLFTLGIGLIWVVPKVVAKVAQTAAKIAQLITKLTSSMSRLTPLLKKLGDDFASAGNGLKAIKTSDNHHARSLDAPPTINPSASRGGGEMPPPIQPDLHGGSGSRGGPDISPANAGPDAPRGGPDIGPTGSRGGPDVAPAGTQGPDNPRDRAIPVNDRFCESDPVDVVTGEMIISQTDLDLPGVLPLVLERMHGSAYRSGRLFGPSWAATLDQRLEITPTGPRYFSADGMVLHFPPSGPGEAVWPITGPKLLLARDASGTYVLFDPTSGRRSYFAPLSGADSRLPLRGIVDRQGHQIGIDHDAAGAPVLLRHSGGYLVGVRSDQGRITTLTLLGAGRSPDVLVATFRYDAAGDLVAVFHGDDSANAMRFEYDAEHRIIGWVDRTGAWYRYEYDAAGLCVRTTGSHDYVNGSFHYDRARLTTTATDSLGAVKTFRYTPSGQVVAEVDATGAVTRYDWDRHDRLVAVTDAASRITRNSWNAAGDLIAVTHPDGGRTHREYDAQHRLIRETGPDGAAFAWEYDEAGFLTAEIAPDGTRTTHSFDAETRTRLTTDPMGRTTLVTVDSFGLPAAVTDPAGNTIRCRRDLFCRVVETVDELGRITRYGWTGDGLPAWRTDPDGGTERWSYDGEGNCVEYVDVLGRVTRTEFGPFNLPTSRVGPDGRRLTFDYDTELRLAAVTDHDGARWTYESDAAGRLVSETDFDGHTVTYTRDATGLLLSRTNSVGQTISYERDATGRIVAETADGVTTRYSHDESGRRVRAVNDHVDFRLAYDDSGRVISQSWNGAAVTTTHDATGRRLTRTTPSGVESVWTYDTNGRPDSLTTAGRTLRFEWSPTGREVRRDLGAGAALTQTWDDADRLRSQALTVSGASAVEVVAQRRAYVYRSGGEVLAVTDQLAGPKEFELDPSGRVTSVRGTSPHGADWTEQYAYDGRGAIVRASRDAEHTAEQASRLREYSGTLITRAGDETFEYDGHGRVIARRRQVGEDSRVWTYSWDSYDRLVGVRSPDGESWRYRYDPIGRRIAKERLAENGGTEQIVVERVDFVWDGEVLAEQVHTRTVDGEKTATVTTWEWELSGPRALSQHEHALGSADAESTTERFHAIVADLVGTPSELVDEHGRVTRQAPADLWGRQVLPAAESVTPLRFPGQYHDGETGLHYNRFRYYDPATARYLSADPLGLDPAPDNHSYVTNPIHELDPLGLRRSSATAASGGDGGNGGNGGNGKRLGGCDSSAPPPKRSRRNQNQPPEIPYDDRAGEPARPGGGGFALPNGHRDSAVLTGWDGRRHRVERTDQDPPGSASPGERENQNYGRFRVDHEVDESQRFDTRPQDPSAPPPRHGTTDSGLPASAYVSQQEIDRFAGRRDQFPSQNQTMGGSASDAARHSGPTYDSPYHWNHKQPAANGGIDHRNPQQPDNMVAGTAGANYRHLNLEDAGRNVGVPMNGVSVSTYIPDLPINAGTNSYADATYRFHSAANPNMRYDYKIDLQDPQMPRQANAGYAERQAYVDQAMFTMSHLKQAGANLDEFHPGMNDAVPNSPDRASDPNSYSDFDSDSDRSRNSPRR